VSPAPDTTLDDLIDRVDSIDSSIDTTLDDLADLADRIDSLESPADTADGGSVAIILSAVALGLVVVACVAGVVVVVNMRKRS
uniref:hypothetical protein n=1 Tax=uncultured Desulfovibrio sp. TaxID=167968 RepID=UPI00261A51A6